MPEVDLSAGTIHYEDSGGGGPVLVLTHGLLMDASMWDPVLAELRGDWRIVRPVLPLGAHPHPMHAGADLTMGGIANLLGEFLERLDLRDVTLGVTDWGGPIVFLAQGPDAQVERVARLVLLPCEAFDNVPPGLPGRIAGLAGWLPGGVRLAVEQLRVRRLRELPTHFGWMTRRGVPDQMLRGWLAPARAQPGVRRDVARYARSGRQARPVLRAATEALGRFRGPSLIVWASEDRVMPPAHAHRLAALLPDSRLVEIPDAYTLLTIDQPAAVADAIHAFLTRQPELSNGGAGERGRARDVTGSQDA
jgi:pimeloyl-ACP methyl ester carboxylesterase